MKKIMYAVAVLGLPILASAQAITSLDALLFRVNRLIDQLIPLIIGISVLYFLFSLFQYVTAKDEDGQKEARNLIVTGVVILFVMVSVWGLVNFLILSFGLDSRIPNVPGIPR